MNDTQLEIVIKIVIAVGSALCTGIPALIAFLKARKASKLAKSNAEKEAAKNDMLVEMNTLINSAEQVFKQVDIVLKQNGETAGPLKKDSVLSKLLAYAISKGYEFDNEYWSNKNDETVKFTRDVNSK